MQPRLDREELAQRFRRQASDLVIQIASLLQGGALSAAAFSLVAIFQIHDDVAIRVMLWLISMILGLVMFFRLCHRALFMMHAGVEVLFMLPVMCLLEIVLFAVISATELGIDGWRYWYVAGVCLFASGVVANIMNLRSMKMEHYAEDAMVVFTTQCDGMRRQSVEGAMAALFTAALGVWIFAMPPDWPYAGAFVSFQLALTIVSSIAIIRDGVKEAEALRGASVG